MIQLYPIEVPGYLIPFITNEMGGGKVLHQSEEFAQIKVDPKSILGMFLRRRIRPDYKIKHYYLTVYSKNIGSQKTSSLEVMEFQTDAQFRIDLSFEELEAFYKFLDSAFRCSFYFFVKGYCFGSESSKKIKEAIWCFIEQYNLLEYGYNENQLRERFFRYRKNGGLYKFFNHERLSDYFFGEK
ncbi:hypothetical protein [Bergeyella zoohelcum]|uniref:Uncharacterized protein n=1 Tax=Bergeyella zoohelcum TaxID=1015 RepID=A0A376BY67_9FLAO|nr:hypothetical protein [Bergeyella zoohelcum]EKB61431.1 hypothetical protein HMPREF9700_00926 [Bergeyella zoohelcum CCUG 30536]SSZ46477.1 Uncharacterised protein [Bergeyella zoohelcum]